MVPTAGGGDRLRLLHVCPFYEPAWGFGGMARASARLCEALVRRGHEVNVITSRLDPSHPAVERREGVGVHRLDGPGPLRDWLVPGGRGVAGLIAELAVSTQIAHLHGSRSALVLAAAPALRRRRRPWVLQPHGTWPHHGRHRLAKTLVDRFGGNRNLRDAAALVAVSRAEAVELPRPARVIPNGVTAGAADPVSRPSGRLLFVGSDHPQKRGSLLPRLLRSWPGARLALVGRFGRRFLDRFRDFGDRVDVKGVLDPSALAREYRVASVVVHPAVSEAFGLVPFEAALAGTPAVVSGGHGCGEWFAKAGGCVVPPDETAAFARAVEERLATPSLGEVEADRVAAFTRRELTWELAAARVDALYRELLEREPAQE